MITVGKLAQKFGLSRSTLLYYHRIGLLRPMGHQEGEYRHYTPADEERLTQIIVLKSAGIRLTEIKRLLDVKQKDDVSLLKERLGDIATQIIALRLQQHITATLLGMQLDGSPSEAFDKTEWTAMLEEAGFSEDDMRLWHHDFELQHPQKHAKFLTSLGISRTEITQIRAWFRQDLVTE